MSGLIDFTTKAGVSYYKSASKSMYPEDSLFELDKDALPTFIKFTKERAINYKWVRPANTGGGILQVENPPVAGGPATWTNVVTNYGEKTLEEIRTHEEAYIATPTRKAQDSNMLYHCLMNSLSVTAKESILMWEDEFNVNGKQSGVLLYKVIVRESHIDSNATSTSIRTQMSNLSTYIQEVGGDIQKFNKHVKLLVQGLAARGERSTDLLVNIFNAYKSVKDETFIKYVVEKESAYEEGKDYTPTQLMTLAESKYKILVDKGTWQALSPEQQKIVALEAEMKGLKKKTRQPAKARGGDRTRGKGGGSEAGKVGKKPTWLWKHEKPKSSEAKKPRKWNGTEYWWCDPATGGKCDGKWRVHKPAQCKGYKKREKDSTQKGKQEGRKAKLLKAVEARTEDDRMEGDESINSDYESE
jgi:hypothetical protein